MNAEASNDNVNINGQRFYLLMQQITHAYEGFSLCNNKYTPLLHEECFPCMVDYLYKLKELLAELSLEVERIEFITEMGE